MEISDNVNADLDSSSVTTTTFESMEVDEVLISSSDISDNKWYRNQSLQLYIID